METHLPDPNAARPGPPDVPLRHRQLSAREIAYLRDYVEPIRVRRAANDDRLAANSFRDGLSDLIGEIHSAPVSHAIVAVAAVVGWTALLVAPILIGDFL